MKWQPSHEGRKRVKKARNQVFLWSNSIISVDPNSKLNADHSPRFSRWTVVQLEHSWIY